MAGPEDSNFVAEPQQAVAYLAPKIRESQALHAESFFVDGYNLKDPEDAERYLVKEHGLDLPKRRSQFDANTGYHLAMAMGREDRAAIYEQGRPQNVAEHSFNVALTTTWVAANERPDLDGHKVALMSLYHDMAVEAYGKDTPKFDLEAMATKEAREMAGLTLFLRDVGDSPIGEIMREYEEGRTPEARFVKAMDKVEAYQFTLATRAVLHRERGEDFEKDIVSGALPGAALDPTAFKYMKQVLIKLGEKWHEWGCKPFEGDPAEIVERIAAVVLDERAEVRPLPSRQPKTSIEPQTSIIEKAGILLELPTHPEVAQATGEIAIFGRNAEVHVFPTRNPDGDPPPPPTTPPTSDAFALASA